VLEHSEANNQRRDDKFICLTKRRRTQRKEEGTIPDIKQNQGEGSDVARWASLISGGAMVLLGLRQRSLRGALTAIAGGTLAYQAKSQGGITEALGMNQAIKVEKTVTINKPKEELYRFWHNLKFAHFMKHLKSVTVLSDKLSLGWRILRCKC